MLLMTEKTLKYNFKHYDEKINSCVLCNSACVWLCKQ
mgnify:CR=1 FL=1